MNDIYRTTCTAFAGANEKKGERLFYIDRVMRGRQRR